ncbi:Mannanase [Aphelenchoides fujianensis]|nr:Mannanase [Aphelenchoides fujianensis]
MFRWVLIVHFLVPSVFGHRFDLGNQKWTFASRNESIRGTARVPGDIFTDLHRNGVIGDPFFGDADIRLRWVARTEWYYRTVLDVPPEIARSPNLFLEFEGVDTVANVYLDGHLLGKTRNQFRTYSFNVTGRFRPNSSLELTFKSIIHYANHQYKRYKHKYGVEIPPLCPVDVQQGECHVNFVRKTQSSFSWDWGPAFPTVGIYKPISLVYFGELHVHDVSPLFFIRLTVVYQCSSLERNDYTLTVLIPELKTKQRIERQLNCSSNAKQLLEDEIEIDRAPQPWFPNGYGRPKLYDLIFVAEYRWLKTSFGTQVGFKHATLNTELVDARNACKGRNFFFNVNSVPVFLKGVNYIPASVFPSTFSSSTLQFYFHSLVAANMNTIRVWGGGEWPSEEFFDLADEHGILVFHDLMFACSLYPTNEDFLENVEAELEEQILRIRKHPSLLIYSGNNELEMGIRGKWWYGFNYTTASMVADYEKLMERVIRTVERVHPSALIIRSSPSNGFLNNSVDLVPNNFAYGDVHFYDELINLWRVENLPIPRCVTEFGVPSFPLHSTMAHYLPKKEWSYTSRTVNLRNHHPLGVVTLLLMLTEHFSLPRKGDTVDMNNLAYLTQVHQAIALRTETEHYRRHRSSLTAEGLGHTMCALYWQLNDVWAAPTWSSIDFDHRWKAAHYHARHMFAPVLVSLFLDNTRTVQLYVVSDRTETIRGATIRLKMEGLGQHFDSILREHPYDQDFFLTAELHDSNGQLLSEALLPLEKLYNTRNFGEATLQSLKAIRPGVYAVNITATDVVPFVWVDLNVERILKREKHVKNFDYHFSDNSFYMTKPTVEIELFLFNVANLTLELNDLTICWMYTC